MDPNRRSSLPGTCEETHYDFLDSKQFRAHFPRPQIVEHHSRFSDSQAGIRDHVRVERWHRGGEIGRGGFGNVYVETEETEYPPRVRAVKEIPKKKCGQETLVEILTMAKMSKDDCYFIRLHGWFQNKKYFYIAMDYYPHGDLGTCLPQPQTLPESEAKEVASQINTALSIMHDCHFTHRDLKPSNIFVVEKSPHWWVKLGDFGVAKRVRDDSTGWHTCIDTPFSAPEVLGFAIQGSENLSTYTSAVDMWSLGFLIHWLLTGQVPLQRTELQSFSFGKIQMPTDKLKEKHVSEDVVDLVQALLRPRPDDRLDCRRTQDHPWFRGKGKGKAAIDTNQRADGAPERSAPSKFENLRAIAKWDYHTSSNNEVFIKKGDIVSILEKPNPEWWIVKPKAGKKGFVYSRYLKEIPKKLEAPLAEQYTDVLLAETPSGSDLRIIPALSTSSNDGEDGAHQVETGMETGYADAIAPLALPSGLHSATTAVARVGSRSCCLPSLPHDSSIENGNVSSSGHEKFDELPETGTRSRPADQPEQSKQPAATRDSLLRSKDEDNEYEHHHRSYTAPAYSTKSSPPSVHIERPEPRSFLSEHANAAGRSSRAISDASTLQSPPDHFASTPDAARWSFVHLEDSIRETETERDPGNACKHIEQRTRPKPVSADMETPNMHPNPETSLPFPDGQASFLTRISQPRLQTSTMVQLPQAWQILSPRPVRWHQFAPSSESLAGQTAVSTPNIAPSRNSEGSFHTPAVLPLCENRWSVDAGAYRSPLRYDDLMAREYPEITPRSAPVTQISSDDSSSYNSYMSGSPVRKTVRKKTGMISRMKNILSPSPNVPKKRYRRRHARTPPASRERVSIPGENHRRQRRSTAHGERASTSLPRVAVPVRPPARPATTVATVDSHVANNECSSDEYELEAYAGIKAQRRAEQGLARLARETASWRDSIGGLDRGVASASGVRGPHLV